MPATTRPSVLPADDTFPEGANWPRGLRNCILASLRCGKRRCDVGSGDAQRLRRSLNAAADEVLTPRTHRPSGPGFNTISYCRSKLKATNCRLHLNSLLVDQHFVGLGAPGSNPTWSTFFKKKFAFFSKKQVYILYFHCGFHHI